MLFPIVGRLKNDIYFYKDKKYSLSQHGFARDKEFELIKKEDDFIEFSLKNTKIKKITGEVLVISNRNIDKIINISQERASLLLNIPTAYEEDTLKVEKVLKDTLNNFKENNSEVVK